MNQAVHSLRDSGYFSSTKFVLFHHIFSSIVATLVTAVKFVFLSPVCSVNEKLVSAIKMLIIVQAIIALGDHFKTSTMSETISHCRERIRHGIF